ncbi:MAG: molybdopterin-guanine dinucleotide biosynthesis protein B [Alphaproteobacteria bacterium]
MKVFGLAGSSNSGKTTLMVGLLAAIVARGVRVSTMKHTHHAFDVDKPGKDSWRHREAGASEVMIASSGRWALLHENRDEPEPPIADLIARMTPVDLLLIEGFKAYAHDKLEVYRPSLGREPLWPGIPSIVAIASDEALPGVTLPVLDLGNHEAIAAFILRHTGILSHTGLIP